MLCACKLVMFLPKNIILNMFFLLKQCFRHFDNIVSSLSKGQVFSLALKVINIIRIKERKNHAEYYMIRV